MRKPSPNTKMSRRVGHWQIDRDNQIVSAMRLYPVDNARWEKANKKDDIRGLLPSLPSWDRSATPIKIAFAALMIERSQLERFHFGFWLYSHKTEKLRRHPRGFSQGLLHEMATKLRRKLGYAHVCFSLSGVSMKTDESGTQSGRVLVLGCIGIREEHSRAALGILRRVAGGPVLFEPKKQIHGLVMQATQFPASMRRLTGDRAFACTRNLLQCARRLYEAKGYDVELGDQLRRTAADRSA